MFKAARIAVLACLSLAAIAFPAQADEFPFGLEMRLDVRALPGSKRIPNLEIEDDGAVRIELWCKGGQGRFSVAGDTVVFVPGQMEERSCPADRAQLDDELMAALATVTAWKRNDQVVTFIGSKTLRFVLLSN